MTTPFSSLVLGGFDLSAATSSITLDGVTTALAWQPAAAGAWQATAPGAKITLALAASGGKLTYTARAELDSPVHDLEFTLLAATLDATHLLCHGPRMGSCKLFPLPVTEDQEFTSWHLTVFTNGKEQLLLSIPFDMDHFTNVKCTLAGSAVAFAVVGAAQEFGGTAYDFPPVSFQAGDAVKLMYDYADAQVQTKRDFPEEPPRGWNSWDYYRWNITEDEVLANAEFIAKDPVLRKHVKRIIVDDGWQYCYGEWEPNPHFSSGMDHLASELTKMGFEPGLWLAPASVEPHAHIAAWDPDMLAMSRGGQPCLGFNCMMRLGFLLDPTVEKSRQWLVKLFDRYSQYGFKYFKLDFLWQLYYAPLYHDNTVPRGKVMHKLMEAVCEGVKGRSAILGCNYPFMTGNSFVESVRVGSDIHATWRGACGNAISIATRFWANKKLWINDPDFAVCRGVDTSDDPDIGRLQPSYVFVKPGDAYRPECYFPMATATLNELRVLLSINLMSGGAVNLSDKMPLLNAAGLDLARRTVAAESGEAAIPLDLFTSERPSLWLQSLRNGKHRLLAINWKDEPQAISLTPAGKLPETATDFWTDQTIRVTPEISLPPHTCCLMVF